MLRSILMIAAMALATEASAQALQPVKISPADAAGPVFQREGAQVRTRNGNTTKDFEMLHSTDKGFSAGIYEAGASSHDFESYREDEFMYFLKGSVTLTSKDGTVTKIVAGDAVTLPKGWTGRWETEGYTKYYVTYDAPKK